MLISISGCEMSIKIIMIRRAAILRVSLSGVQYCVGMGTCVLRLRMCFNRFQVRCDYISVTARRSAVPELNFNYTAQMALKMRALPQFAYYHITRLRVGKIIQMCRMNSLLLLYAFVYVLFWERAFECFIKSVFSHAPAPRECN
jgi:hypothetical protein